MSKPIPTPSIDQCRRYMEDFSMYDNIREHSFMVARVAEILLRGLEQTEIPPHKLPNRDLVIAGALLHDIAKTKCIEEKCRHDQEGETICNDLGLPQIAPIVRDHVILSKYRNEKYQQGIFNATELVFYADKRVNHHQVVSLDARLDYILTNYGANNPSREALIIKNFNQCRNFETHLFDHLDFFPESLPDLLDTSPPELIFQAT